MEKLHCLNVEPFYHYRVMVMATIFTLKNPESHLSVFVIVHGGEGEFPLRMLRFLHGKLLLGVGRHQ